MRSPSQGYHPGLSHAAPIRAPEPGGRQIVAQGVSPGIALLLAVLLSACARAPQPPTPTPPEPETAEHTRETALVPVPVERLPLLFDDGDWRSLDRAIGRSVGWLKRRPAGTSFVFGPREVTAGALAQAYEKVRRWLAEEPSPETFAARMAREFEALESAAGGEMLVTGYYEPVIAGSRRRTAEYRVPVYGPPGDLIRVDLGKFSERWKGQRTSGRVVGNRLLPYPDRRQIRTSGLPRARVLAWARDPVDLFFIEVQGSGALQLPDGGELRIGYAGANGRGYKSIGKLLIDEGLVAREKISMQSIRAYLAAHPEEIDRVLDYNPSVVFFRRLDGPPLGSLGLPVTPRRSIATDHRLFPPGALGFLITDLPAMGDDGRTVAEAPLTRFVLNHDRGGAIRGTDRVDFFWGRGPEAAERAGVMKQPGRLLFLVPAPETAPAARLSDHHR